MKESYSQSLEARMVRQSNEPPILCHLCYLNISIPESRPGIWVDRLTEHTSAGNMFFEAAKLLHQIG